jgi:hypothetical protein
VPSHIGIRGNEVADQAAKQAADSPTDECGKAWTSLAHLHRIATETQSRLTEEFIQKKLAGSRRYVPRKKWGLRAALINIPKKDAATFLQMASGHALIGVHLKRIKRRESDECWWCRAGCRQTRGHLFGGCRRWKKEFLELQKRVEHIQGTKRRNRGRLKAVSLFKDERLTEAVLDFLKATGIGRRFE